MTEFGRKCDLQNGRKRCLLSSSGNDHLNGLFWAESVVARMRAITMAVLTG
jgi:hypothetical protein